jgi:preprotein translocase subunit SecE
VSRRNSMQDTIFVIVTVIFFVVSIGYVHFCERVK